jgi:hypothetical protein
MPETSPVIDAANRFGAALARGDQAAGARMVDAYRLVYERLQDKIDLLVQEIGLEQPTAGQLVRMRRYTELMTQTQAELQRYGILAQSEVERLTRAGVDLGESNARALMSISLSGSSGVSGQFNRLPVEVIQRLVGFLTEDSPLYQRLGKMGEATAELMRQKMIEGIGLGYNPRKIASIIVDALGQALTDTLRTVRTANLWAYREANRATYIANQQYLAGWVWHANLNDDRTCMSCIAMHGTVHPLDEPLDDHHNGRCAPIPLVIGRENPVESGVDWFENLSEAEQRSRMGAKFFEAWQDGKFKLADMPGQYDDDVYGQMRRSRTLQDLLGDES